MVRALQIHPGIPVAMAIVLAGCDSTPEMRSVPVNDPLPPSISQSLPKSGQDFSSPDVGELSVKEPRPEAFYERTYPEDSKTLAVSLAIEVIAVKQGTMPKLTMTVKNLLDKQVFVVGPPMTNSENGSEVIVLKDGERVEVPVVIGHEPFVQDKDYVPLASGGSMKIKMETPYAYDQLEPGDYDAYVVYVPDPRNRELKIISPRVSFSVVE